MARPPMAGVHTYKKNALDVTIFAIDHSVGRGGANRMDDVQLIQIMVNRYIDWTLYVLKELDPKWPARVVDGSGRQLSKLKVDGKCGPRTLAAILAVQRSLKIWRGVTVDGRIDPIAEGGASQYQDGTFFWSSDFKNDKIVREKIMRTRFNTMYLLGVTATFEPNPPWNIFLLPEPLKSSLLRTSIGKSINSLARSLF